MIPTDFSKHARKVIECVGDIPGVKEIVLLSVISRSVITRVWDPAAELKEVEKKLTEEKKIIAAPGIDVKIRAVSVLEGEVAKVIHEGSRRGKGLPRGHGCSREKPDRERFPGKRLQGRSALRRYASLGHAL